jgi:hypothetical protein
MLDVRDGNKRSLAKASIDPGGTSLFASEDSKVMITNQEQYTMDDFSTLAFREPWLLKKISTSTAFTWLAGRELMPQGRQDLRQETKSTKISKRPLRRKGRPIKEFHNFLYER